MFYSTLIFYIEYIYYSGAHCSQRIPVWCTPQWYLSVLYVERTVLFDNCKKIYYTLIY